MLARLTVHSSIAKSINRWTNKELGYLWLMKVFDPATKEEANGLLRVLLLDGHSSHYSEEFLEYARKNNIILLGYPPHCTHTLQGLDVICFAKMKTCWQRAIVDFESKVMRDVSKAEFLMVWAPAYLEVFNESTTCAAFKVTGIIPFNPNFVTAEQMKPSQATSTHGEFPMPQPSPVCVIINSMRLHPPARFDLSHQISHCRQNLRHHRRRRRRWADAAGMRWRTLTLCCGHHPKKCSRCTRTLVAHPPVPSSSVPRK
jgi:hypothetical protein